MTLIKNLLACSALALFPLLSLAEPSVSDSLWNPGQKEESVLRESGLLPETVSRVSVRRLTGLPAARTAGLSPAGCVAFVSTPPRGLPGVHTLLSSGGMDSSEAEADAFLILHEVGHCVWEALSGRRMAGSGGISPVLDLHLQSRSDDEDTLTLSEEFADTFASLSARALADRGLFPGDAKTLAKRIATLRRAAANVAGAGRHGTGFGAMAGHLSAEPPSGHALARAASVALVSRLADDPDLSWTLKTTTDTFASIFANRVAMTAVRETCSERSDSGFGASSLGPDFVSALGRALLSMDKSACDDTASSFIGVETQARDSMLPRFASLSANAWPAPVAISAPDRDDPEVARISGMVLDILFPETEDPKFEPVDPAPPPMPEQ